MVNLLSEGSLAQIFNDKDTSLTPLVQILGTKVMSKGVRAVISDGVEVCQHCLILTEDAVEKMNSGQLNKYSVIRLENFTLNPMAKNPTSFVLLVNNYTMIKSGEQIDRKLAQGEAYDGVPMEAESIADRSSVSALSNLSNNLNQPANPPPAKKPTTSNLAAMRENVCQINILTPFYNAWLLRVRVTNKGPLRTYSNKNGPGKLFSFDVCDESGEIRFTAFNTECDRFYDMIEQGKIYYISRGAIKPANKKFSSLNNEYEITLTNSSAIEECTDNDDTSIPQIRYKFIPLSDLNNLQVNTPVDVIGIIRSVSDPETLISKKTQKELVKKEISFVDKSLTEVRVTLWNDAANNFTGLVGQIVALKGALVGEFRGKTLSSGGGTSILVDPDIPETLDLRTWYDSKGANETFTSLSKTSEASVGQGYRFICNITHKLLAEEANNDNGQSQSPAVFSGINAFIMNTNRSGNQLYKACSDCGKKLQDNNDGIYNCTKCDKQTPTYVWRLMLSINIADATGSTWVTAFHESGEKLLGRPVQELAEIYERDPSAYNSVLNELRFKTCYFRVGSRSDEYNNEKRIRSNVYQVSPHEPTDRAKRLMKMIDILQLQLNA